MTELIWDGKYKNGKKQGPVRVALPFQTVETVNESAQDRQRTLEWFAAGRETEWRNRLIWGDKKYVLPSLLPEFTGKVNLIYIDPPFGTGADFSFSAAVPESDGYFEKEPSILEQKAYRDTWGGGVSSYVAWFYDALLFLRELLSDNGSIYVHLDFNVGHYAKTVLDEVFGLSSFRNEIVWKRTSAHANVSQRYGNVHDVLLFYSKSDDYTWNQQHVGYDEEYLSTFFDQVDDRGRRYARRDLTAGMDRASKGQIYAWKGVTPPPSRCWAMTKDKMDALDAAGKIHWPKKTGGMPRLKLYPEDLPGTPLQDLWLDMPQLHNLAAERLGYPTQKPEALLGRIIRTSSNEGDLVLDCFAGSGTTAAVAGKLNRRWIACDLSRFAIHTARKRLLGISGVKPFIVQNLGKYERQAWQAAEFPASGEQAEAARQRDRAYRNFILELYRATPISGHAWLHGCRGGRMVHVAPVDAPVTLADVKAIAKEVWKAAGTGKDGPAKAGVDILGWEFAFEVNELARQVAAESRVDVALKKIPHEVLDKKAVEQGDVRFFELGALSVTAKQKERELALKLKDFLIPIDDIPEDVRKAIKHWSQMIDYWAVDWDFKDDTFHNQWQSYRTRKEPKIELEANYAYSQPGRYTVVIKVIDILGNDTTKAIEVDVR
jgi:DNA modification methylase